MMDSDTSWFGGRQQTSRIQHVKPPEIDTISLFDDDDDPEGAENKFNNTTKKKILRPFTGGEIQDEFHNTTRKNIFLPFTGVEIQDEFKFLEAIKQFKMILEQKIEVSTLGINLKELLYKYLLFFATNYARIGILYKDQYLDVMEDILVYYCDVIKEFFRDQRTKNKRIRVIHEARKVKILFKECLMNKMDRIVHVLLKVRLAPEIQEYNLLWEDVYPYFLAKVPYKRTEDDILRGFIAFQKLKTIKNRAEAPKIDKFMLKEYKKTNEELRSIPCLNEILDRMQRDKLYTVRDMITLYMRYYKEKKRKNDCFEMEDVEDDEFGLNDLQGLSLSDPLQSAMLRSTSPISRSLDCRERMSRTPSFVLDEDFSLDEPKIENSDDSVVILDDEDDDDVIIVSDNLKSVITIDDDEDEPIQIQLPSTQPPREPESPDKLVRPPEESPSNDTAQIVTETPAEKSGPVPSTNDPRLMEVTTPSSSISNTPDQVSDEKLFRPHEESPSDNISSPVENLDSTLLLEVNTSFSSSVTNTPDHVSEEKLFRSLEESPSDNITEQVEKLGPFPSTNNLRAFSSNPRSFEVKTSSSSIILDTTDYVSEDKAVDSLEESPVNNVTQQDKTTSTDGVRSLEIKTSSSSIILDTTDFVSEDQAVDSLEESPVNNVTQQVETPSTDGVRSLEIKTSSSSIILDTMDYVCEDKAVDSLEESPSNNVTQQDETTSTDGVRSLEIKTSSSSIILDTMDYVCEEKAVDCLEESPSNNVTQQDETPSTDGARSLEIKTSSSSVILDTANHVSDDKVVGSLEESPANNITQTSNLNSQPTEVTNSLSFGITDKADHISDNQLFRPQNNITQPVEKPHPPLSSNDPRSLEIKTSSSSINLDTADQVTEDKVVGSLEKSTVTQSVEKSGSIPSTTGTQSMEATFSSPADRVTDDLVPPKADDVTAPEMAKEENDICDGIPRAILSRRVQEVGNSLIITVKSTPSPKSVPVLKWDHSMEVDSLGLSTSEAVDSHENNPEKGSEVISHPEKTALKGAETELQVGLVPGAQLPILENDVQGTVVSVEADNNRSPREDVRTQLSPSKPMEEKLTVEDPNPPSEETGSLDLTPPDSDQWKVEMNFEQSTETESSPPTSESESAPFSIFSETSGEVAHSTVNEGTVAPMQKNSISPIAKENNVMGPPSILFPPNKVPERAENSHKSIPLKATLLEDMNETSISSPSYDSIDRSDAEPYFKNFNRKSKESLALADTSLTSTNSSPLFNENAPFHVTADSVLEFTVSTTRMDADSDSEDGSVDENTVIRAAGGKDREEVVQFSGDFEKPEAASSESTNYTNLKECYVKFRDELSVEDIFTTVHDASAILPTETNKDSIVENRKVEENTASEADAVAFLAEEAGNPSVGYPECTVEETGQFNLVHSNEHLESSSDELNHFSDDANSDCSNKDVADPNVVTLPHRRIETIDKALTISGSQPYSPQSSPSTRIETVRQDMNGFEEVPNVLSYEVANSTYQNAIVENGTFKDTDASKRRGKSSKRRKSTEKAAKSLKKAGKSVAEKTDRRICDTTTKTAPANNVEEFREDLSQSVTSAKRVTPQEVDKISKLPFIYSQPLWNGKGDYFDAPLTLPKLDVSIARCDSSISPTSRDLPRSSQHKTVPITEDVSSTSPIKSASFVKDLAGADPSIADNKVSQKSLKIHAKDKYNKDLSSSKDRDSSLKAYKAFIKDVSKRDSSSSHIEEPQSRISKPVDDASLQKVVSTQLFDPNFLDVGWEGPVGKPLVSHEDNFFWDSDGDAAAARTEEEGAGGTISVKPDSQLYKAKEKTEHLVSSLKTSKTKTAAVAPKKNQEKKKVVFDKNAELGPKLDQTDLRSSQPELLVRHEMKERQQKQMWLALEMMERQRQSLQKDDILFQFGSKQKKRTVDNSDWFSSKSKKIRFSTPEFTISPQGKDREKSHVARTNGHLAAEKRKNRYIDLEHEEGPRKRNARKTDTTEKIPKIPTPNGKVLTIKLQSILKSDKTEKPSTSQDAATERNDTNDKLSSPVKKTKSGRVCKKPRSDYDELIGSRKHVKVTKSLKL